MCFFSQRMSSFKKLDLLKIFWEVEDIIECRKDLPMNGGLVVENVSSYISAVKAVEWRNPRFLKSQKNFMQNKDLCMFPISGIITSKDNLTWSWGWVRKVRWKKKTKQRRPPGEVEERRREEALGERTQYRSQKLNILINFRCYKNQYKLN